MRELILPILRQRHGSDIGYNGAPGGNFVYLDDAIFTGERARQEPPETLLCVNPLEIEDFLLDDRPIEPIDRRSINAGTLPNRFGSRWLRHRTIGRSVGVANGVIHHRTTNPAAPAG